MRVVGVGDVFVVIEVERFFVVLEGFVVGI